MLLDINLPGLDGLDVLVGVRASHAPTALPVIMTTGYEHSEMVVRALELGANDYVSKPYDLPVLRARVQTQLSIKRMVEETARLEQSLVAANQHMKANLIAAARVQESLLPRAAPQVRGGRFAWRSRRGSLPPWRRRGKTCDPRPPRERRRETFPRVPSLPH